MHSRFVLPFHMLLIKMRFLLLAGSAPHVSAFIIPCGLFSLQLAVSWERDVGGEKEEEKAKNPQKYLSTTSGLKLWL